MPTRLAAIARSLRRNATNAERRLWRGLRRKEVAGFRFRRQVPLGGFIADFASFDARLVIEVDGATHSTDEELARDAARTAVLAEGFALLRFTNKEVFRNLDGVLEDHSSQADRVEAAHRGLRLLSSTRANRVSRETDARGAQSRKLGATPHPVLPPQGGKGRKCPDSPLFTAPPALRAQRRRRAAAGS